MKLKTILLIFVVAISPGIAYPDSTFQLSPISEKATANTTIMQDSKGEALFVINEKLATEEDLEKALSFEDSIDKGKYVVRVIFKKNARHNLYDITKKYLKQRLGIIVNGRLLVAPEVFEAIDGDSFDILCCYTKAEADQLIHNLNSAINKANSTPNNAIKTDAE